MSESHNMLSGTLITGPDGLVIPRRVLELHRWRKTTIEGAAAIEPPKSGTRRPIKLDWLPIAADAYHISDDPRDYVVPEVGLVTADVPNRNMHCFEFRELMAWNPDVGRPTYQTFIGKPTHADHKDNTVPALAKGVNFDSVMSKERNEAGITVRRVRVLSGFDRTKDPDLARSILKGERRSYSMGAMVKQFICTACKTPSGDGGGCLCINDKKGAIINGVLRYLLCRGVNYIENSSVKIGADHLAVSSEWWG